MILPLDENHRIKSDPHCWQLQKRGRVKDKDTGEWVVAWNAFAYLHTIEACVKRYADQVHREADVEGWEAAMAVQKSITDRLKVALEPLLRVPEPS